MQAIDVVFMNEPTSTGAGLLTLSLLAGTKTVIGPDGKVTCRNNLDLPEVKHYALSDSDLWPGAAAASVSLFAYTIPKSQILIIDYVSLYSFAADESTPTLDWGLNTSASCYWQYTLNGAVTKLGTPTGIQNLVNRPCFVVFPSESTPQLVVGDDTVQTDQSRRINVTANAWQCADSHYQTFLRYSTVFQT